MEVIVLLCETVIAEKDCAWQVFYTICCVVSQSKSLNMRIVAATALFKDKPFHNHFSVMWYCQEMQYALPSLIRIIGP